MSKTVFRYDRGELRRPERTSQGFLKVEGRVARAGVYPYRRADGSIQLELRPEEEVFSPRSLASYEGVPITLGHPRRGDGELEDVTADNVKKYEVGSVLGPARRDGDYVVATLLIKDAAAIKRVEAGQQELSPGYRIRLDETSGVDPKYGAYHVIQRGHDINHQAVVDQARGGRDIRLRLDDAEIVLRTDATLDAAARHHLPGSMFAVPEHEGLPLEDASHVRSAMSRFNQEKWADAAQEKTAYHKILARAKTLGIDASGFKEKHGGRFDMAMPPMPGDGSDVDLTTIVKGHQHTIATGRTCCTSCGMTCGPGAACCSWCGGLCRPATSGTTSWAISEGAEDGHSHDWVRNEDGAVTIAMTDGHTHGIIEDSGEYQPAAAPGFVPGSVGIATLADLAGTRADRQFDRSAHTPEHGLTMTTQQTGSAPPPTEAEQIRLLTVRADEADRSATEQRTRADALAASEATAKAELATIKERLKATEDRLAAGTAAVENAAVLEQRNRADAAERELSRLKASIPTLVRNRADLVNKATAVLGPTFRVDGLTDREVLVHGIRHLMPKEPTGPDVDERYLRARFDALIADRTAYGASLSRASETLAMRTPSVTPPRPGQQVRADELPWADQWKAGLGQFSTSTSQKGT